MAEKKRPTIERKHEMRNKGISKMISEGGLGADKYYNIHKDRSEEADEKDKEEKEE